MEWCDRSNEAYTVAGGAMIAQLHETAQGRVRAPDEIRNGSLSGIRIARGGREVRRREAEFQGGKRGR